ncbi:hypothetical protein CHM34_04755 [Paludifilum halophilum]|uniref:Uncharacterized protein n=1 Tax=Paludifilum halophilum TaxID=1642702 RepID=A0A235BAR2_9BACL|nr:hypothetical protein CHM34_04755 [Paludifilum halophilum]
MDVNCFQYLSERISFNLIVVGGFEPLIHRPIQECLRSFQLCLTEIQTPWKWKGFFLPFLRLFL